MKKWNLDSYDKRVENFTDNQKRRFNVIILMLVVQQDFKSQRSLLIY